MEDKEKGIPTLLEQEAEGKTQECRVGQSKQSSTISTVTERGSFL